ncbi:MAG: IS66 family insertion sequence element accessory protein TnpA [Bacteroidales bacterium]
MHIVYTFLEEYFWGYNHQMKKQERLQREEEMLTLIEQWSESGKTQKIFFREQGITFTTFYYWLRRYRRRLDENGFLPVEIDNNLIENSILPVALGRKNYLFAGSNEAAQQAAMIYSFLGICKINNIEPCEWLKNTLQRIPNQSIRELDELLPCSKG